MNTPDAIHQPMKSTVMADAATGCSTSDGMCAMTSHATFSVAMATRMRGGKNAVRIHATTVKTMNATPR